MVPTRRKRNDTAYARQGGERVHVVGNRRKPMEGNSVARCGSSLEGPEYVAYMVPEEERCRSRGCRDAWPPYLRVVVGG